MGDKSVVPVREGPASSSTIFTTVILAGFESRIEDGRWFGWQDWVVAGDETRIWGVDWLDFGNGVGSQIGQERLK